MLFLPDDCQLTLKGLSQTLYCLIPPEAEKQNIDIGIEALYLWGNTIEGVLEKITPSPADWPDCQEDCPKFQK